MTPDLAWVSILSVDEALAGPGGAPGGRWLTARERATHDRHRVPKRRREWLAGRLAAKEAVRHRHGLDAEAAWQAIEIAAVAEGPERGRPFYRLWGEPGPFALSIAHCGDWAVATLADRPGEAIGLDLERLVPCEPSFEALLLAPAERARLVGLSGPARVRALTWIWVLKEALLKAMGVGLRAGLADVEVQGDLVRGIPGPLPFRLAPTLTTGRHATASTFERDDALGALVVLEAPA